MLELIRVDTFRYFHVNIEDPRSHPMYMYIHVQVYKVFMHVCTIMHLCIML